MNDCIFCKIVKKEIPAYIVHEDENFLAFLDINPLSDGHLLIIPKSHIPYVQDADDETISNIFILAKKLVQGLRNAFKCNYVKIVVEGEQQAHFHVHLIPKHQDNNWPKFPIKKYKDGEASEIVKKITSAL